MGRKRAGGAENRKRTGISLLGVWVQGGARTEDGGKNEWLIGDGDRWSVVYRMSNVLRAFVVGDESNVLRRQHGFRR
jgi:hypothetical protein